MNSDLVNALRAMSYLSRFSSSERQVLARAADALASRQPASGGDEPAAARYDFDGYGWRYIDGGSGSDWMTRHPDAELLYTRPAADVVPDARAVAYLDIGAGGYMDVGTDLTEEQLAELPRGRHMLGIIGTYGVEGYAARQFKTRERAQKRCDELNDLLDAGPADNPEVGDSVRKQGDGDAT